MQDADVVVIGSGAGGLTAALALARAGRRVVVFEQHTLPGGYSQSFQLQGFRFSPGVHYIGELGPGGALRQIYEGLGVANDLEFFELDPDGYDRVFIGEEHFDIPAGLTNFRERLKVRFPREAAGIDEYFRIVDGMSRELAWAAPPSGLLQAIEMPWHMRTVLRYGLLPLSRFLDRFTNDPLLRAILSIQAGDHGMSPSRAPTALHAGLQSYYFNGGCYPRGGGHHIPETLIRHLKAHGGRVVLGAEVSRVVVAEGRVRGVELADGTHFAAPVVVANADPGVLWGRLVEEEHVSARLRRRVRSTRYSVSTLSLFLGVDMDLRHAGLDSGNIWFSRTTDIDASYRYAERSVLTGNDEIPGLFFNVTTLKDPTMRTDGLHTVEAIALASIDAFARWEDLPRGSRGPEYATLKAALTDRMLDAAECFVPGLRDRVVFRALGTPLTNAHFLRATRGSIYGTEKTIGNLGAFSFPVRTPIPGLYQCGASTIAPGIHGVTRSGLAAAAAVLGCEPSDLLSATGQSLRIRPSEPGASSVGPSASPAHRRD
jgi:all-trans-retinol 13,14-reductase